MFIYTCCLHPEKINKGNLKRSSFRFNLIKKLAHSFNFYFKLKHIFFWTAEFFLTNLYKTNKNHINIYKGILLVRTDMS